MATTVVAAGTSSSCIHLYGLSSRKTSKTTSAKRGGRRRRVRCNLGSFTEVVRKDMEFMKRGIGRGLEWANDAFRIPKISKTVDDFIWLRNLEDPRSAPLPPPSWPRPSYPGLSGDDLFMADLKALEAYANYFYYLSKLWSKPLPEVYDAQDVADYFNRRPHLVALRLIEVFSSFASAALMIRSFEMRRYLGSNLDKDIDGDVSKYNFGVVLKETLLKLGPTFIKVGQSLSTRPDIIGSEISKALSGLHDQIPPFPRTVAMKIIEEELGSPVHSFFSYITEEPVAAASFGQVYKGTTLDGYTVAVKVQRPNMHHVVVRDIYILRLGLGLVQKIAKRKNDLRLYADELGKGLVGELNYFSEADNVSQFQAAHSRFPFICVPKVYHHLSRKRVLTMEWIVGESPTDLLSISTGSSSINGSTYSDRQKVDATKRLLDLVNKGVEASLVQLLETGILHADPHPGNLRYTSSGQLGFLDFGLICQMEKKHQYAMLAAIVHIVNGDWESLVYALVEMDVVRPGTNMRRVTLDLEYSLGEVEFKDGIPDVKFSKVLGKIWSVALKYHFRMPPYFTLLLRSIASLEGLAVAADTNFKTFEAAYPYVVRKLLTENSAAMRKILHSVVLNKKKEFQWQRLALFVRLGGTRKGLQQIIASNSEITVDHTSNKTNTDFEVARMIMRILPSKEGIVFRRLLMTANGNSLIQALVSKEARFFRQQLCRNIADVLSQWFLEALGQENITTATTYNFQVKLGNGSHKRDSSSLKTGMSIYDFRSILKDRRLKLIFSKVVRSASKDPLLMLKCYWISFVILVRASALACHRTLVSLSEAYLGLAMLAPKRHAVSI